MSEKRRAWRKTYLDPDGNLVAWKCHVCLETTSASHFRENPETGLMTHYSPDDDLTVALRNLRATAEREIEPVIRRIVEWIARILR